MGSRVNLGYKVVKPVLSLDNCEARTRVLGLYKAFYRFSPYIVRYFDIEKTTDDVRCMIKAQFMKNKDVEDVRVIDVLVIKGYMELKEMKHNWMQKSKVMSYWRPTHQCKPCGFIANFLANSDG